MTGPLNCGVCGTGFRGRSDAQYCSPACRQKAHRGRTAKRLAVPRRTRTGSVPPIKRPDVAGTILRAHNQQLRAHELCRNAAEILRKSRESQQRASAIRRLTSVPPTAIARLDIARDAEGRP